MRKDQFAIGEDVEVLIPARVRRESKNIGRAYIPGDRPGAYYDIWFGLPNEQDDDYVACHFDRPCYAYRHFILRRKEMNDGKP